MRARTSWFVVVCVVALAVPAVCLGQPTSSGHAIRSAHVGQLLSNYVDDSQVSKWYEFTLWGGRSYCGELGTAADANIASDPILTIYRTDGTTAVGTNDDANSIEPSSLRGSRFCFIAPANETYFAQITDWGVGPRSYTLRLVETTLWASWFFIGGDYNSFVLLRNTTVNDISYTITWRNQAGWSIGTTSGTVPANGAIGVNAKSFVTTPTVNVNGSVEIAHTGSPEGLVGQVTSLSASTGLGFDSPTFKRQPW